VEQALGLSGAALLYVGDNWLADVQGAKRAGWQMVLTRQWQPPETFPREADHFEPDAAIGHLAELERLLVAAP
jgi:FMN phosphatase YigB (HAD superfamily)